MGESQLNELRPRLGVLLVTSGWFRDVGLQGASSETTQEVARAGARIVKRLEEFSDPVYDGVLSSTVDAEKAARRFLTTGVDGVLIVPLMWCEDAIPPRRARDSKRPPPSSLDIHTEKLPCWDNSLPGHASWLGWRLHDADVGNAKA